MNRYLTALLAFTILLPSTALAQLTPRERERAQELARIQAKADAEERSNERFNRRWMAKSNCESSHRQWDNANDTCKPK